MEIAGRSICSIARIETDDRKDGIMNERLIPEIGAGAPSFALSNQDGNQIKLSDFRGQWVALYFYPKDDTPG